MRLKLRRGETLTGLVRLDGHLWEDCTFRGCRLEIGGKPFRFAHGNHFIDTGFTFDDNAGGVVMVLQYLYTHPGFRPMIEDLFESIRNGLVPSHDPTQPPRDFDA